MIEKDITTWEEFKNALTENITEVTTYNIKNDLDASNDILIESINCISPNEKDKILMGNGYKINGITAYGNFTIFKTNQDFDCNYRFYDVKFTNFMAESAVFSNLCRSTYNSYGAEQLALFTNCFFNGVCRDFTSFVTTVRVSYFYKCSLNVRCANFASTRCSFDSCYIITTPLQNDNNLGSECTLINSYIEGTVKNTFSSSSFLTSQFNNSNVFNCEVIITNYSDSTTYVVQPSNAPVLINKDRLLQSDGVTPIKNIAPATNVYFLTDEQMKNKDYIQQNTTFPLYG